MDGNIPFEWLDIVNSNDEVIGRETKDQKFAKDLISRNVAVFIKNASGKFLIARRSQAKKSFPGRLDLAVCGNVKAGESYEEAAYRELKEELGIICKLDLLDRIYNEFKENSHTLKYFTGIFLGTFSGDISPNWEAAGHIFLTLTEIDAQLAQNSDQFTPGFVHDYQVVSSKIKSPN
jgi:isopentenyldiphosphate isomerase